MQIRADTQRTVLWPLRVMVVASLVAPALLFLYATVATYRAVSEQAGERIERALDVAQEHAAKAFQTIDRTISETNEVLRDLTPERIRAEEQRLSLRLKRTRDALQQIEAIWVFDKTGHPLVSSALFPVPAGLDNSERDYFRAHTAAQDVGTFIGEVITAKIGGAKFFVVSQRRPSVDGAFDGIIAVSVFPSHFRDFYVRLSQGLADSFSLVRADGAFLARYPSRDDWPTRLNADSVFAGAIVHAPEAGRFKTVSQIDGVEREIGYRKLPGYPVYVQTGVETGAIWRQARTIMAGHLVFGIPATLLLFALSVFALRRTEGFHNEVARREVAESALKQAQRLEAIGQLTGGVAHDFNNLLMVVAGNVERLRRHAPDERQSRALDAIDNAAQRGASLVRQLLSFSRKQTHEPTVVPLAARLPELEDMLRSSLRGDIVIELQLQPDLWPIKVDVSEFELAVLNIAVNSRDAMPAGGKLSIAAQNVTFADPRTTGLVGSFVALSIADTGCGMPADVVQRVFEPFFTTKEVGKGTGLGLSQVYGFARQSGGTATVTSAPGQGTTITLYLPRTTEQAGADAAAPAPGLVRDGRGRILVVEDNGDVAEVTVAALTHLGYDVTQVRDAASALALTQQQRFDLVFSDIVMPGAMNGLDLARALRARTPPVPVLLATGYSEVAQVAADEAIPLVRKPYAASTLSEAVRGAIRARLRVVA